MVKAWNEQVVIPTYEPGTPEKNPIFLENRVYQGSSGVVYPYPVIEKIADEKTDHTYNAVWLENEYIKVMVLPELGGRIQMAYDKIRQRHFIYYNQVVKPALVGLAGPWISGGIEFNWPQHHRPSTFTPIDHTIEENADGSVTVWVSERERMFHQQGQAGFTLRPGCAYLEIKGRLYNPTPMPQTFLWWANPAVAVNDHYQSVFPPDINAVFDHGKRAVSSFPIATGTYYKMDYSAGVDISNYRNIKVPTSYMAVNSKYNFEGGYENDTQAGMLHVASHHVSPGKKQWTWGNGDFGRAWDRNLTDSDGPYIELMAGVYTENQPDFSWLMPYEEKAFTQYFLPYRELGVVKNASKDLLLNITADGEDKACLKVFATSRQEVRIAVSHGGSVLYEETVTITPEDILCKTIDCDGNEADRLAVSITDLNGKELLTYEPEPDDVRPIPDAAEAALRPEEIKTCEQLFLTGLHLEQYRHATFCALDYYEEALRRDPLDVRNNNAVGLWYLRRGRAAKAEPYLRKAVKVLMKRNPNPYDGEPLYNLALSLKLQGRYDEAYSFFYKATWNAAWQAPAYLACAQISSMQDRLDDALWEADRALIAGWHNHKARALKANILNRLGRVGEAKAFIAESLAIDPFNFACLYENKDFDKARELMRDDANDYDQTALDYCAAGCWREAINIWQDAVSRNATTAMTFFYLAWCNVQLGNADEAKALIGKVSEEDFRYCFPNRLEAVLALNAAMSLVPENAVAPYLLGCLYYDKRQYDLAISLWKTSLSNNPDFPTAYRNLALATFNKLHDADEALRLIEQAFRLDTSDARVFMERDQLFKRLGKDHQARLDEFDKYPELVSQRDDLILERITLLNLTRRHEEAAELLDRHVFHPWEGGEGKVPAQYQLARVEMAKRAISDGSFDRAVALLSECLVYPHHLGEGKLHGALDNDFLYFLGVAYRRKGDEARARECWQRGAQAPMEPAAALYYNDAAPDKLFYAALCERALGNEERALSRFNRLTAYGGQHLHDEMKPDYFAVSLPDLLVWDGDIAEANRVHCLFMLALGNWGLGNREKADRFLAQASALNPNHLGIFAFRSLSELV